jgi:hypothetical protein
MTSLEAWHKGSEIPFRGGLTVLLEVYPAAGKLSLLPGRDNVLGDEIMGEVTGAEIDH